MEKSNSTKSFTLIETIIVVAIMSLFAGLSLAYYNGYAEEKKLESEEKKVIDVLELAKKKAQAGDLAGYSCDEFNGYQVVFAGSTYYLRLCCNAECSTVYNIQTYSSSSNVQVSAPGDPSILFLPLNFRTNLANTVTITVKNTRLNKCIPVYVYSSGLVDEGAKSICTN